MKTIHRYSKDTLRGQMWELQICEENGVYTLNKTHQIKDNYEVIKEVTEVITQKQAEKYMEKNKDYHIETYRI